MLEDKKTLRILAVMSSPTIMKPKRDSDPVQKIPQLEVEKEWQALRQAVEGLPVRLERCYPPTLNKMEEMLRRAASPREQVPYQVLHFSGHGDIGGLLFEDGSLQGVRVDANRFGKLFKDVGVKLVILSACYSGVDQKSNGVLSPAELLANTYIPAVIRTNQKIRDDVARTFSKAFFTSISDGYTIKNSFDYAQQQLENDPDIRGAQKTVLELTCPPDLKLETSDVQPGTIDLVPPQINTRHFHNDYFFGREEELAGISLALGREKDQVITTTGMGGSGKSTLAKELAKRNAWRYPGGLVWADFRDEVSIDTGRLLLAVQEQLGVEIREGENREEKIMARLRSAPCLLVADNMETVAVAARDEKHPQHEQAKALAGMLGNMPPTVQVLCTGREPLGLVGELEKGIVGLDLMAAFRFFLDVVEDKGRILRKIVSGLEYVENEDKEGIHKVTEVIFNLPLPIYLSASTWARTPGMTLEGLNQGLKESCKDILVDPSMTGDDAKRHKSMMGTIEYSYKMLESESAKELFPRLSTFAPGSGFDDQAVEKVCKMKGWEKGLEELVRKSMVEREWLSDKYSRYRLFPPVQEFASDKLEEKLKKRLEREFAEYFAGFSVFADELVSKSEDIKLGMLLLELELDNLNWALELSLKNGWEDEVAGLMNGLDTFYRNRFAYHELSNILSKTLEFYEKRGDKKNIAVTLHQMGMLAFDQNHYEDAMDYYQRSLAIKEEIGDRAGLAQTLHQMGILAEDQEKYNEALDYYERSLAIEEEIEDKFSMAATLHQMGMLAAEQENYNEAVDYYQRSLAIKEEIGDRYLIASTLHQMGMLAADQSKYEIAMDYYRRSLPIWDEIGDKANKAKTLHQMGMLAADQEKYNEAMDYYERSLAICKEIEDRAGVAQTLHQMGMLAADQEKYNDAMDYYQRSLAIKKELGDRAGAAITLHQMGLLAADQEKYYEAMDYYQGSLAIKEELGNEQGMALTFWAIGDLYKSQNMTEESLPFYTQALTMGRELNSDNIVNQIFLRFLDYYKTLGEERFSSLFLEAGEKILSKEEAKDILSQIIEFYEGDKEEEKSKQ